MLTVQGGRVNPTAQASIKPRALQPHASPFRGLPRGLGRVQARLAGCLAHALRGPGRLASVRSPTRCGKDPKPRPATATCIAAAAFTLPYPRTPDGDMAGPLTVMP